MKRSNQTQKINNQNNKFNKLNKKKSKKRLKKNNCKINSKLIRNRFKKQCKWHFRLLVLLKNYLNFQNKQTRKFKNIKIKNNR